MTPNVTRENAPHENARGTKIDRRALLSGTGLVATAAAVASLAAPAQAFHATPAETAPRYQDSEHVKTFYRVAGR